MESSNCAMPESFDFNEQDPVPTRNIERYGPVGERPSDRRQRARVQLHAGAVEQCDPPLGDLSRCGTCIVAPVIEDPHMALRNIKIEPFMKETDWLIIKQVKKEAEEQLADTCDENALAKTLLLVRLHASNKAKGDVVADSLKALEKALAESVGRIAHKMALARLRVSHDGSRPEFLRGVELQCETPMTPRLHSRMLLTYHKLYGSDQSVGEALFNSKSHAHFLRKGYKRPGRKKPRGASTKNDGADETDMDEKRNEATVVIPQAVAKPSKNYWKKKNKAQLPSAARGNMEWQNQPNAMMGFAQSGWQGPCYNYQQPFQEQPYMGFYAGDWNQSQHITNACYSDSVRAPLYWCW
jgi:hypothetical protein